MVVVRRALIAECLKTVAMKITGTKREINAEYQILHKDLVSYTAHLEFVGQQCGDSKYGLNL
jgi:hypothetical protein